MRLGIHSFVQYPDDLDTMGIGCSKENYVTALRKLPVPVSNGVSANRNFGGISQTSEGIEQFRNVGITLGFPPLLQWLLGKFPQVSVSCGRKLESTHSC